MKSGIQFEFYMARAFFYKSLAHAKYPVIMVAAAAALVILIISVAEGLDGELVSKIIGASSHVEITTSDGFGFSGYEGFIDKIKKGDSGLIAGITPRLAADSIISKDEYSAGIRLIGTDFTSESLVSPFFPRHEDIYSKALAAAEIKKPQPGAAHRGKTPASAGSGEGGPAAELPILLAGKALYDKFKMSPGGRLKVTTITSEAYFSPAATFEIGIYDYDISYCFCDIKALQKLLNYDGIATSILVKLNDIGKADEFAKKIKNELNDDSIIIRTYRQINKSLFATIKIERMVLFLIIFLSLALANMAVAFVISQNVHRRSKTIAIMNALGADTFSITKIFFYEGLIYGVIGLAIGAAAGIGGCFLIDWISIGVPREVTLYYSVTSVPVKLNYINILIISSIELFVLLLSSVAAARKIFKTDIIESLRNS